MPVLNYTPFPSTRTFRSTASCAAYGVMHAVYQGSRGRKRVSRIT
jgi:hypothetical protein